MMIEKQTIPGTNTVMVPAELYAQFCKADANMKLLEAAVDAKLPDYQLYNLIHIMFGKGGEFDVK